MKISIITLFPNLFKEFFSTSIIGKSIEKKILEVNLINLLEIDKSKRVDAHSVSHAPGVVLKPEILKEALCQAESKFGEGFKIFFSPQGIKINQDFIRDFSEKIFSNVDSKKDEAKDSLNKKDQHLILICSRYEGIDQRIIDQYSDLELSIGDYILMGGDIPAQVFLECFLRLVPGVVKNNTSLEQESFESPLLDADVFCKPVKWDDREIPEVLLSGNHKKIDDFNLKNSLEKTLLKRFDWFRSHKNSYDYLQDALKTIPPHYAVIMYDQVLTKDENVTTTSIKSLDIHDIARACKTYGIEKLFIVTPLKDQKSIAKEFLKFWLETDGRVYNESRYKAVKNVVVVDSFSQVTEFISNQNDSLNPIILTTSAKRNTKKSITFNDQSKIWAHKKPVVIVFGTGSGLNEQMIEKSDYLFVPIDGMSGYNHLSVRSAAAIVFDRWLGLNLKSNKFDL